MKFKVALTITDNPRPFLVQVAIPNYQGLFQVSEFSFTSGSDALMWTMDYFNAYKREPWAILSFHKEKQQIYRTQMDLPFGGF